jgi:hypothetical protein
VKRKTLTRVILVTTFIGHNDYNGGITIASRTSLWPCDQVVHWPLSKLFEQALHIENKWGRVVGEFGLLHAKLLVRRWWSPRLSLAFPWEFTPSYILHTRAFMTYLLRGLFTLRKKL